MVGFNDTPCPEEAGIALTSAHWHGVLGLEAVSVLPDWHQPGLDNAGGSSPFRAECLMGIVGSFTGIAGLPRAILRFEGFMKVNH